MPNRRRFAGVLIAVGLAAITCWSATGYVAGDEPAARDTAESASPEAPVQPASAADIARWATELSAPSFLTRETAMLQLIQAGAAAIEPVRAQLDEGPEAAVRGIHVLQQLALSGDLEVEKQAREVLQQIAEQPAQGAAARATRLAAASLDDLDALRQQRTLQYLVRLGAQPTRAHRAVANNTIEAYVRDLTIGVEWQGTDEDLKRLRWLRDLESITFEGAKVKDAWFAPLADMPSLNSVIVKKAKISDEAMQVLPKIERLSVLELKYVPIGNKSLPHLAALRQVTSMKLYGTQVTMDARDQLRQQLPTTEVDLRRGAFLGVGCHTHPLGCQISVTQPGSAADRAGLNSGDVIIRYNEGVVPDFETLTELISLNAVGDKVNVVAVRQAQLVPFRLRVEPPVADGEDAPEDDAPAAADDADAEPTPAIPAPDDPDRKQPEPEDADEADEQKPAGAKPATLEDLGLEVAEHPVGCRVTKIDKTKIAYRVGIRENDVIFDCNSQRVSTPDTLSNALAKPLNDFHLLEVARNFDILKKEVELGEWD